MVTRGSSRCQPRGLNNSESKQLTMCGGVSPNDKDGGFLRQPVRFSAGLKINSTPDSVTQVDLAVEQIGECRCVRVYDRVSESGES